MRRTAVVSMRAVAALGVLSVGAACGSPEGSGTDAGERGPVIAVQGWNAYPAAEIVGRLSLSERCLLIGDSVAFWAAGTSWDSASRSVVFDSGDQVTIGEEFVGGGGHYSRGNLDGLDGVDVDAVINCLDRTGSSDAVVAVPPASPA